MRFSTRAHVRWNPWLVILSTRSFASIYHLLEIKVILCQDGDTVYDRRVSSHRPGHGKTGPLRLSTLGASPGGSSPPSQDSRDLEIPRTEKVRQMCQKISPVLTSRPRVVLDVPKVKTVVPNPTDPNGPRLLLLRVQREGVQ